LKPSCRDAKIKSTSDTIKRAECFFQSIEPLNHRIAETQSFDFHEMDDIKWAVLKEIFQGVKVLASRTTLVVGNGVYY
jgi:hypothetical protein